MNILVLVLAMTMIDGKTVNQQKSTESRSYRKVHLYPRSPNMVWSAYWAHHPLGLKPKGMHSKLYCLC